MPFGVVKWYDVERGFGFITPDVVSRSPGYPNNHHRDIFVHYSAILEEFKQLSEGERVYYDVSQELLYGPKAVNVRVVGWE